MSSPHQTVSGARLPLSIALIPFLLVISILAAKTRGGLVTPATSRSGACSPECATLDPFPPPAFSPPPPPPADECSLVECSVVEPCGGPLSKTERLLPPLYPAPFWAPERAMAVDVNDVALAGLRQQTCHTSSRTPGGFVFFCCGHQVPPGVSTRAVKIKSN